MAIIFILKRKQKMKKRNLIISLLLVITMCITMITSCSSTTNSQPVETDNTQEYIEEYKSIHHELSRILPLAQTDALIVIKLWEDEDVGAKKLHTFLECFKYAAMANSFEECKKLYLEMIVAGTTDTKKATDSQLQAAFELAKGYMTVVYTLDEIERDTTERIKTLRQKYPEKSNETALLVNYHAACMVMVDMILETRGSLYEYKNLYNTATNDIEQTSLLADIY